jgi:signal transduction histidine kinase
MTTSAAPPTELTCPQCHAPISPSDVTCDTCGANIALVTLMAERAVLGHAVGTGPLHPVSVEQLVPRLGEYLVRNRYITEAQLQSALARQAAVAAAPEGRTPRRIGYTLIEMGFISRETLDKAVAQQVLELQSALIEANRSLEKRVAERTAELEDALVKLAEFNQLKANFVANISHELRTPLTQIKGYNALLMDGAMGGLSKEQKDALSISARAIERLEQLVNDLIGYASTAKGELTLKRQPMSLAHLVNEVMEKSMPKAQRRGLLLSADVPADLSTVVADEEKVRWVLLQLVDNAIKFTGSGGSVAIQVALLGLRVRVSVRDTGIGIPSNRREEIFDSFRQLDGSSTRRYGGTGLGLALVRRIVEAHGGEILVDSEEGVGSTFSFTLPRFDRP